MRPILFEIPIPGMGRSLPVFGFGLMFVFALLGAMQLAAWRARREKLDPDALLDMGFWVVVGGILGARGLYVWQYWGTGITSIWSVFKIWEGGIVFYGCILGGAAAIFAYWAYHRFPFLPTIDVVAPSLALGIALGRLGCFMNGCCYGDRCDDLPLGVTFPAHSSPWNDQVRRGLIPQTAERSLPIHPTQLYSALDGLVLLALVSAYYPLRRRDGEVLALLAVTYPITRFLIERLRNDEGAFFAGMTISQNISVLIFAAGVLFWAWLSTRPAIRYADTAPEIAAPQLPGTTEEVPSVA